MPRDNGHKRNILTEKLYNAGQKIGIRIKGNPNSKTDIPVDSKNSIIDFLEGLDSSSLIDTSDLSQFRTISTDRELRYRTYDEMALDSMIATALEMYADDATQYNSDGQVIWAESEDTDVAAFANRLIDTLNLNNDAWSHIYSMCKYGDLYLETFYDDEIDDDPLISNPVKGTSDVVTQRHKIGAQLEEYIEAVSNPAEIFDITKRGKTVGFIKIPVMDQDNMEPRYSYQSYIDGNETQVLPPDKYVHICLSEATDRNPETLSFSFKDDSNNCSSGDNNYDNVKTYRYKVNRGKSILHDVYKSFKELQLMEDAILLNRVTRSPITRIMQIEVGDMPKNKARELLKRVKHLIEQKNFMDKGTGKYTSMASPGPVDNVIYVPTHDGKGTITMSSLGGDVDVKSIVDLDYFKQKVAGGLKIPLAFLSGQSDDGGGLSSGTALTKLDSRYARTIKRIQNAYINGITTLINLYALSRGLTDHVNNFVIKMVSPSTIEDQERDEVLDNHTSMIGNILDLLSNGDMFKLSTQRDVLIYLFNTLLNEPDIAEILEKDDTADHADEMTGLDNEEDLDNGFDGGDTNFDIDMDDGTDDFSPENDLDTDENDDDFQSEDDLQADSTGSEEEEEEEEEDFGNYEDEY